MRRGTLCLRLILITGLFAGYGAGMARRADHESRSPERDPAWQAYWANRAPFDAAVRELQEGVGDSLAVVLRFLEERPRFLQSGYMAERMLRFLDRPAWNTEERAGVVRIAHAIATEGRTREAREAKRLLARLGVPQEES